MSDFLKVIVFTTLAGAAMPLGGALACVERIRPRWLEREVRHGIMAFGGGVLFSAVALVLVPEGVKGLPLIGVIGSMMGGGVAFCVLDILLNRAKTSAAQLVAMLSDFLPEALALGALFAHGGGLGPFLALLIALQSVPEAFNAYRELAASGQMRGKVILAIFVGFVPIGPLVGLAGFFWLSSYPAVVHAIMLFSAGGILYLMFEDIAPKAHLECDWAPPLGAVAGFLFGLIGQLLITS
ncbi:MAG: divalent cation transporter [Nitrospiraceae bacterium]|nr:divalent cation transporter [Nitrospiraceae bacterium]